MSIFDSHLDKARRALTESNGRLTHAKAELEAHRLAPADPGDFDAQKAWLDSEATLARDVDIAESVIAHWQGVVAKLEAEAADKAKAAEKVAAEKEARAAEALVREIARDAERLAAKIAKLEEHRERAQAAGVDDAEMRVRGTVRKVLPAEFETRTAWFDAAGNRFATNITVCPRTGRDIEATDRVQREVQDEVRPERIVPPTMPERFASAIRLVDLEGRPL